MSNGVKFSTILAMGALLISTSVEAKHKALPVPPCWTVPQITAAKVNELSIKLNVESLRCRTADATIMGQYDDFTRATSKTMSQIAKVVQGHFRGSSKLYDNYAISLANKYGAGVAGESCAQVATFIQAGVLKGAAIDGLSSVAEMANINPTIVGGACPLRALKPFVAKPVVRRVKHHK